MAGEPVFRLGSGASVQALEDVQLDSVVSQQGTDCSVPVSDVPLKVSDVACDLLDMVGQTKSDVLVKGSGSLEKVSGVLAKVSERASDAVSAEFSDSVVSTSSSLQGLNVSSQTGLESVAPSVELDGRAVQLKDPVFPEAAGSISEVVGRVSVVEEQ